MGSDSTTKELKGKRPLNKGHQRRYVEVCGLLTVSFKPGSSEKINKAVTSAGQERSA